MAVLPESMDKLDVNDVQKSLSIIENYIGYMGERIEFSMSNVTKSLKGQMTSAQMYILLQAMSNSISAMQSSINGMNGTINGLSTQIGNINSTLSTMQGTLESLDQRVSALENPTTTT